MNINIISANTFQVAGLTPSTQYWYAVNDNPDLVPVQFIAGDFTTDGAGESSVLMVENSDIVNWVGEIKVYEDAALTIEVPNSQQSMLSVEGVECPIGSLRSGCSHDYPGVQELKCLEMKWERLLAQLKADGKCVKNLKWERVYKECEDCETGIAITVIDVCESLKELN